VDKAVAAKQSYETKQIKQVFHELGKFKTAEEIKDPELKALFAHRRVDGKLDFEALERETEKKRQPLAELITALRVPVEHTIRIQSE
jgi:hypothetical protein